MRTPLVGLLLLCAACLEDYHAPGSGPASAGEGDLPPPGATSAMLGVGPAPLRRLTKTEYNNTVRDLLGDTTRVADTFPQEGLGATFVNDANHQVVSDDLVDDVRKAAEALASRANWATLLSCPVASATAACVDTFIDTFGKRAYRRPVTTQEHASLRMLFDEATQTFDAQTGVTLVLEAMLQDPAFLFRVEYGGDGNEEVVALTGYELASRLSYFLWQTTPDDALLSAAESGALASKDGVRVQAERLLADPKARATVQDFYAQWLRLGELAAANKDASVVADFAELRGSLLAEAAAYVDHVVWEDGGSFETLLTAPYAFVDAKTAPLYGVTAPAGAGMHKVALDATQRAGFLTHASTMANLSHESATSPTHRGQFLVERLLCNQIAEAPPGLALDQPSTPSSTQRELALYRAGTSPCSGCHKMMDNLGVTFEMFDAVGRVRTNVDTTGELALGDPALDGHYGSAVDLVHRLKDSKQVKQCFSKQWFRFALGRYEDTADQVALDQLSTAFADNGWNIPKLLLAMTQTDAFRFRQRGAR